MKGQYVGRADDSWFDSSQEIGIIHVDWEEDQPATYRGLFLSYGEPQQIFEATSYDRNFATDLQDIRTFAAAAGLLILASSSVFAYMRRGGWRFVEEE